MPLLVGLAGTALVRPHITALLFAGLFAGVLVRRTAHSTLLSPIARVVSIVVMIGFGAIVVSIAASFLKLDTLSFNSVTRGSQQRAGQHRGIGQSTFTPHPVHSALDLPGAMMTVLFRPFPWEAGNLQILVSSAESVLFMVFIALSGRRWRQVPRLLRRYPYIMAALVTILMFIIAFSTFGNFGLLVRERVMIVPLLLVPLCLACRTPATTSAAGSSTAERIALQ